jgi:hypothetical protein
MQYSSGGGNGWAVQRYLDIRSGEEGRARERQAHANHTGWSIAFCSWTPLSLPVIYMYSTYYSSLKLSKQKAVKSPLFPNPAHSKLQESHVSAIPYPIPRSLITEVHIDDSIG